MDLAIEAFNKYAKLFDFSIDPIKRKYEHTIRVVKYCHNIALSLDMSDEEIELAMLCGLFHDISRFKQYTEYQTFIDALSFDHGDESYNIFDTNDFNLMLSDKKMDIIKNAIKNHNKYDINPVNEEYDLYAKIVRDADKLDIIMIQNNEPCLEIADITDTIYNAIMNHQLLPNTTEHMSWYGYYRSLGFIFDINFKYGIDYLYKQDIVTKKISLINVNRNNTKKLEKIKKELNKYMEEFTC